MERFDLIVIGSGAAGLSVALAAKNIRVALFCKGVLGLDGASCWAQSGVAAPISSADSTLQHASDTLSAGSKANHKMAARWMIEDAADVVSWLAQQGVQWDRSPQGVLLNRGAGHSVPRTLHAGGDATGAEIMRALREAVATRTNIKVFEFSEAERLIKHDGRVVGAQIHFKRGDGQSFFAPEVVLATGGCGQLFKYTSNPIEATGSGLALAHAAGASLSDMEFMQFHPTGLANRNNQETDQLPLLSESLRGAGARLVNSVGVRFMAALHEHAELAPADITARAVFQQMEQGQEVFLDARGIGESLRQRFPTVFAACSNRAIDPRYDLIPVTPVAHYQLGGVKVDMHSSSSLPGLYAVGEVAHTGVHGANRLGGNSLLEAIAFGRTLGERLNRQGSSGRVLSDDGSVPNRKFAVAPASEALVYNRLRNLMWAFVGIQRTTDGLQNALEQLRLLEKRCLSGSRALDQLLVARVITEAALARPTSLGSHVRIEGLGRLSQFAVA